MNVVESERKVMFFSNIFNSEKAFIYFLIDFYDDDRDRYYQHYILVLDKILSTPTDAKEKKKKS